MRFMIIVKATADSEDGVLPPPSLRGSACEVEVRQLFEAADFASDRA